MIQFFLAAMFTFVSMSLSAKTTELHALVEKGELPAVRGAIKKTDVNSMNEFGETPLILSVSKGFKEMTELLLQSKADVNKADSSGNTPLFYAVSNSDLELVELLLKSKADTKIVFGQKKENVLFEAARTGNLEVLRRLLSADTALLTQKNTQGQTVLFISIELMQSQVAKELLKQGLSLDDKDSQGVSARQLAQKFKMKL